jgi:hypothetical protein
VYGPESINHFNLFNSITVNALPKKGFSTAMRSRRWKKWQAKGLPRGYTYEWTGMTKEEINSGGQSTIIFLLCLVFVYFLLAAQYESYILPLSVILSIPLGIFGVFVFINLFGIDNNIYVQVGLIMLIGLLAKNAILIVEYALQRRQGRGQPVVVGVAGGPAAPASRADDLAGLHCGHRAADVGHRRLGPRQPFHQHGRRGGHAHRRGAGRAHHPGAVRDLPALAGTHYGQAPADRAYGRRNAGAGGGGENALIFNGMPVFLGG